MNTGKPGDFVRYTGGDGKIYESMVSEWWDDERTRVVIGFYHYGADEVEVLVSAEQYAERNIALEAELIAVRAREAAIKNELKLCRDSKRYVEMVDLDEEYDDEEVEEGFNFFDYK